MTGDILFLRVLILKISADNEQTNVGESDTMKDRITYKNINNNVNTKNKITQIFIHRLYVCFLIEGRCDTTD